MHIKKLFKFDAGCQWDRISESGQNKCFNYRNITIVVFNYLGDAVMEYRKAN